MVKVLFLPFRTLYSNWEKSRIMLFKSTKSKMHLSLSSKTSRSQSLSITTASPTRSSSSNRPNFPISDLSKGLLWLTGREWLGQCTILPPRWGSPRSKLKGTKLKRFSVCQRRRSVVTRRGRQLRASWGVFSFTRWFCLVRRCWTSRRTDMCVTGEWRMSWRSSQPTDDIILFSWERVNNCQQYYYGGQRGFILQQRRGILPGRL